MGPGFRPATVLFEVPSPSAKKKSHRTLTMALEGKEGYLAISIKDFDSYEIATFLSCSVINLAIMSRNSRLSFAQQHNDFIRFCTNYPRSHTICRICVVEVLREDLCTRINCAFLGDEVLQVTFN